ncbi:MAG: DUF2339 domain-containing protein [Beijerinckiaceae bacterium]|nr:DUF2339 domain-containing protein [Beijerinckiaceae bacterium]
MEMLLVLLGLVVLGALVLGPLAFFIALRARDRAAGVEMRFADAEARLAVLESHPLAAPPLQTEAFAPERAPQPAAEPVMETAQEAQIDEPFEPMAPEIEPERPQRRSLEEALGARWSVIVGGVALALGALLLVRYSIEQGFFGPGMRVAMGVALAVALVGAGEFMRRRERVAQTPAPESGRPDIPAILTAAGTVAAFGAIYAAHALYGFIGPATAFIALAAAGVACMFASALHGPALAALGLVGALGAPLLVSSPDPNPWPVAGLAAVVAACAYWLALMRGWLWLAVSAAFGGGLWGLAFLDGIARTPEIFFAGALTHLILQTALAAGAFAWSLRHTLEGDARPEGNASYASAGFAALGVATLVAALDGNAYGSLWLIGALAALAIPAATGFMIAPAAAALAIAGAFAVLVLRIWPDPAYVAESQHWSPSFAYDHWPRAIDPSFFAFFGAVAASAVAIAGGWRISIARALPFSTLALYAGAAALTPLAVLSMAFVRLTDRTPSVLFAIIGAALALGFALAAAVFRNAETHNEEDAEMPNARFGAGVFASAAISALALAFVFFLQGATLTVALALAALGAAYVSAQLRISALRWCVAGFGVVVAARLALEPRLLTDAGPWPILNWLLFAYGIPALAFGAAAWIMRRTEGEDTPVRVAQSLCILFSAFLVFFEIRHFINDGDAFARRTGLVEQGLFAVSALTFAIVLTRLDAQRASIVFRWASLMAGALSFAAIAIGLGFAGNPLFSFRGIEGGRFINALLIGYALPAILALILARVSQGVRPYWYGLLAKACAIALAFGYVTLQTRRLFHNERIGILRITSEAEWYAYSAVWLALGIALLAWGIVRGSKEARIASAIFVSASVLKVFLFDLAGLEGALRALSFIGLGATLIAIGLVYQKLVFARPTPALPTRDNGAGDVTLPA